MSDDLPLRNLFSAVIRCLEPTFGREALLNAAQAAVVFERSVDSFAAEASEEGGAPCS